MRFGMVSWYGVGQLTLLVAVLVADLVRTGDATSPFGMSLYESWLPKEPNSHQASSVSMAC